MFAKPPYRTGFSVGQLPLTPCDCSKLLCSRLRITNIVCRTVSCWVRVSLGAYKSVLALTSFASTSANFPPLSIMATPKNGHNPACRCTCTSKVEARDTKVDTRENAVSSTLLSGGTGPKICSPKQDPFLRCSPNLRTS